MSELIFILIILYAAYVIKSSCNEKKQIELASSAPDEEPIEKTEEKTPVVKTEKSAAPAPKKAKVTPKKLAPKKVAPVSDGKQMPSGTLRNPETGEEAKIANSYRMSKRWIKEALVTEGLLEKIYKTNEINDATKIEINKAFEQILQLKKYQ